MSTNTKDDASAPSMVPLCVPEIRGHAWDYVKECLDTGWVSSVGAYVDRAEGMMADYVGTRHAVATVNGTSALHMALLVAGVQPGDEVVTSDMTFIAPANAIRYAGAWPVFIDTDPVYWQMDPLRLEQFLTQDCLSEGGQLINKRTGRPVKALMPVHILGHPLDLEPLLALARQFGLVFIEDASESLGARYGGGGRTPPVKTVGSVGDLACFSFNGNKIVTGGGGGMVVTNHEEWAHRVKYLTTQAKDDPIEYEHHHVGYNYRLTNLQAALICAQMELLDTYVETKRAIAARYTEALGDVAGFTLMREAPWARSSFWMYTLLVDEEVYGESSRALLRRLAAESIQTRPLWQPMHRSLAHGDAGSPSCPVSDRLFDQALSLPCSVGLTEDDQSRVLDALLRR